MAERAEINTPKRIDITEFRELGYLQEVNRCFLHPLGLALEVIAEECEDCGGDGRTADDAVCAKCDGEGGSMRLGGVWDAREDPEGIIFGDYLIQQEKIDFVGEEWNRRHKAREALFGEGHVLQRPTPKPEDPS